MGKRDRKNKHQKNASVAGDDHSWLMLAFWAVIALVSSSHSAKDRTYTRTTHL